eukprot:33450-Prymnesium_polylepis.1
MPASAAQTHQSTRAPDASTPDTCAAFAGVIPRELPGNFERPRCRRTYLDAKEVRAEGERTLARTKRSRSVHTLPVL